MLRPSLVTVEDARRFVLEGVEPLAAEPVAIDVALGRVLAEPVTAAVEVPAFDNSAMDGFAVRSADCASASVHTPVELAVVSESRAGNPSDRVAEEGEAIAISTGAAVPAGTDAVVPVELVERENGRVLLSRPLDAGANVRRAGEDLRPGELVLEAGTVLGPAEVGVLASLGRAEIPCRARPSVAVVVTGDELRDPDEVLGPGQIHDTNGFTVPGLARLAGARVVSVRRAADRREDVLDSLRQALEADVAVVCGGVSVGEHDHVRWALGELGVPERFWGVALKPGRPTWFGLDQGSSTRVLGLPGNPVSAMVTFMLLARPLLLSLAGVAESRGRTTAILDRPYAKKPGRTHAVRCRMSLREDGWHVIPTKDQGSHVLSSMLGADCLAFLPADAEDLPAGTRVDVEPLPRPAPAAEMGAPR